MFFDTLRYQLFDGKLWCPLFFYPQNLSMPENFWNIERTIYKVFQHCLKKDFQRKVVISPSYAKDVSILEIMWNTKGVPYEIFRYQEKKFLKKKRDTPPLLFSIKIFEVFWNKGGFPYEIFWYCETKNLTKTCETTPLLLSVKIFQTGNFSETQNGSSTKCFGTVSQNSFYGKSWYPPTLLSVTFFDTRSFLKHRRVFQQIFGSVRQKTFDWNREYSSSPQFIHKMFR